ncbi:MAG: RNA methyltransferase [Clostridia bacterium]|nr:RNA methyltransferase [Clostridia bacterium]
MANKKDRNKECAFLAEGEKLTLEAIKHELPILYIFISESAAEKNIPFLQSALTGDAFADTEIIITSDSAFEKISTEKAPEGIITVIKYLDFFKNMDIIYKEEFFLSESERCIALCSVRDPGNLGSVIRSAVAFGVDHIVVSSDSADIYNPKTIRSAMGNLFAVKITVVNDFASFVSTARESGRRIFSAELRPGAKSVKEISLLPSDIFMIGNEGHGIPEDISAICTDSVYIPISERTESLNASVAAAIFMWEQNK